ncbi:MAG: hypothetical protein O3B47_04010 [bacterium]|nr:hypothetical protein [bacterium]
MGHIMYAADKLGIPTPEINLNQPFLELTQIGKAIQHATTLTDLGFGEVDMKLDGLIMLMQALRRHRDAKLVTENALENARQV